MTTPTNPPPIKLYVEGAGEPFLTLRPELAPKLGPVVAGLLERLRADGIVVRLEPENKSENNGCIVTG